MDEVKGKWKQIKGKAKEKWRKLTDDDLNSIDGRRDQLIGKLQKRYGRSKDVTEREVDKWIESL